MKRKSKKRKYKKSFTISFKDCDQVDALFFKLPEQKDDLKLAIDAWKYKAALEDIDNWLRGLSKYSNKDSVSIDEVRDKIREFELELF